MNSSLRMEILETLEKNARVDVGILAKAFHLDPSDVANEMADMEKEGIIFGYHALINWDKTPKEVVTAMIELKVVPKKGQGFGEIARQICKFEEVDSVYLMSGGFDFMILLRGKTMKEVAFFVAQKLSVIESVTSTATHFVLEKYKDHGFVLEEKKEDDRPVVSF